MTASHNLEDAPRKNVTLKHADTPQHHSHLSKTTQHHITENGFTAYRIRHKEYTLALISADTYCLRTCRFSCIKRRHLKYTSSKHMQKWYRDRKDDTPYPYGFFVLYRSILFFIFSYFFSISIFIYFYLFIYILYLSLFL